MSQFLLPNNEDSIINIKKGDFSIEIEVIDLYDLWKDSGKESDKADAKDWIPYFVKAMKEKYDVDLNRTSAVLLIELVVTKLTDIKKSCSPELKQ